MFFDTPTFRPLSTFGALRSMQAELERLFADASPARAPVLSFALFEREDGLLARTALPGLEAKDVALEVDGDRLTLSGELLAESEAEHALAAHRERATGKFTRTLRLPFEVDAARVQARLVHGVLEIEIPRVHQAPPVKIDVQTEAKRS